jgi:carbon storage regulator CsrA
MLVLSRKEGEAITIGENIELTVTKIYGNRVLIGISAPAQIKILRNELQKYETNGIGADQPIDRPSEIVIETGVDN